MPWWSRYFSMCLYARWARILLIFHFKYKFTNHHCWWNFTNLIWYNSDISYYFFSSVISVLTFNNLHMCFDKVFKQKILQKITDWLRHKFLLQIIFTIEKTVSKYHFSKFPRIIMTQGAYKIFNYFFISVPFLVIWKWAYFHFNFHCHLR